MALAYQDAYTQIKALEADGASLPLPAPTDAIFVGSVDARTGVFTWAVPTFQQTIKLVPQAAAATPMVKNTGIGSTGTGGSGIGIGIGESGAGGSGAGSSGGQKTGADPPTVITVGAVATNCVNLTLIFEVTDVPIASAPLVTVTSGGGGSGVSSATGTGNVTITGFPNLPAQGSKILLNAGVSASAMEQTETVTPPIGTFPIGITVNGQLQYVHVAILRPPVLGIGAFTIPALPVAIIFSPPQGVLEKNSNTFNDKVTYTRTVTTAYSTQNATKTAQAYQPSDIVAKIADLASAAGALGAGLPGITVAGAGGGSAMAAGLINVISGPPGGGTVSGVVSGGTGGSTIDNLSLSDALKDYGSAWKIVGDIMTGLGDQTVGSTTTSLTTETDTTMTLAMTTSDTYGSAQGLGPGDGDRFIWLSKVLAMWVNANGDVGIVVLGFDGVMAYPGASLVADQKSLEAGGAATNTGLDAQSIGLLLSLDPYYMLPKNPTNLQQGLIIPPRFVPAVPTHRAGTATSSTGDIFSDTNESISDTTVKSTNQNVNVTDTRPGWIDVLMGAAQNVETTTTLTVTNGTTIDDKSDEAITNTITMYSQGANDPYDMQIYYDQLFGTLMPIPTNSPVLQGTSQQKLPTVPAPAGT